MMNHTDTIYIGAIGSTTPLAAAVISLDPMLDFQLRIISMCIGILVGVASLSKLAYDIWVNHKKRSKK